MKKIAFFFLLWGIIGFLGNNNANAEYVVFKITKNPISRQSSIAPLNPKEFEQIYKIVTQYKWPTNVFTFYANPQGFPINYDIPFAEEEFIRTRIKALNADYEIAFIPDILYEAAFLGRNAEGGSANGGQVEDGAQEIQATILSGSSQYTSKLLEKQVKQVVMESLPLGDNRAYYNVLGYMYNLNLNPTTMKIAFDINSQIVAVIKNDLNFIRTLAPQAQEPVQKSRFSFKKAEGTTLRDFLPEAIRKYFTLFDNPQASWNALLNKNLVKSIIQKTAQLEQDAAASNTALIFRGSQGNDSPLRMKQDVYKDFSNPSTNTREQILLGKAKELPESGTYPYSISFGFSLGAGMATESGGNVYRFIMAYGSGYALKIKKKEFFDKNRSYLRDMFFVPPHGIVFSYYATDDLFHPRTKVGIGQGVANGEAVIDQLQLQGDKKTAWIVDVNKDKKWDDMAADIANYISKDGNAELIFPLNKSISGDDILSTFHTDLLHFKKHVQKMAPVFQELKSKTQPYTNERGSVNINPSLYSSPGRNK